MASIRKETEEELNFVIGVLQTHKSFVPNGNNKESALPSDDEDEDVDVETVEPMQPVQQVQKAQLHQLQPTPKPLLRSQRVVQIIGETNKMTAVPKSDKTGQSDKSQKPLDDLELVYNHMKNTHASFVPCMSRPREEALPQSDSEEDREQPATVQQLQPLRPFAASTSPASSIASSRSPSVSSHSQNGGSMKSEKPKAARGKTAPYEIRKYTMKSPAIRNTKEYLEEREKARPRVTASRAKANQRIAETAERAAYLEKALASLGVNLPSPAELGFSQDFGAVKFAATDKQKKAWGLTE